jgi:hypothetical protein
MIPVTVIASEAKRSLYPLAKWFEIATIAKGSLTMTFRQFNSMIALFPLVNGQISES